MRATQKTRAFLVICMYVFYYECVCVCVCMYVCMYVCVCNIFEFPIDIHVYMFRHVIEAIPFHQIECDISDAIQCIEETNGYLIRRFLYNCL